MPAPKKRRSDAEIVDEMLALLKPPADQREPIRAKVLKHIDSLRGHEQAIARGYVLSPGKVTEKLDNYLKALRQAARKHSTFLPVWLGTGVPYEYDAQIEFGERLDAQINRIRTLRGRIKVKRGR
jgi:hypothetical protein